MTRLLAALLAALLVCPALAGCLQQAGFRNDRSVRTDRGTPCDALASTERGRIEAEGDTPLAAISPLPAIGPFAYRSLTDLQCQCLAVRNAELANLLDSERQVVALEAARGGWLRASRKQELSDMQQRILINASQEIRNRNAAAALELYYHLAEAEAKLDLVEQSSEILRDVTRQFQEMKQKGLRLPIDYETLARQQIEVQVQQTQLQLAVDQLNRELTRLLGLRGCASDEHLWPASEFAAQGEAIDIESAVAEGLAQRPELELLREVEQRLNAWTLPAVRPLVQSFHGLLGVVDQQPRPVIAAAIARAVEGEAGIGIELDVRRHQLQEQLADGERAVALEIRQAVRNLAAQHQLIALTRQKVHTWETRVRELEDRNKQGLASFTEVALGKLDWLRARGDLVKELMAWHIARAKLRQAQGILARECADFASPGPSAAWPLPVP
jgi:hypothetical protein